MEALAKREGKAASKTYEFWFRKKYGLPPTDDRFLDATLHQMQVEYWAYQYDANPNLFADEDEDFDLEAEIAAVNAGNYADEWEEISDG